MRVLLTCVALLGSVPLHAQAPVYNRGDEVRLQTSDGKPASPPIQRVIAVPGDRLKVDKIRASINDKEVADLSPKLLATCGTWMETIPVGHYFLVGEELEHDSATRSCSLVPASRIIGRIER
jgi:hypothetical protein